jgi:hypothetical protein
MPRDAVSLLPCVRGSIGFELLEHKKAPLELVHAHDGVHDGWTIARAMAGTTAAWKAHRHATGFCCSDRTR